MAVIERTMNDERRATYSNLLLLLFQFPRVGDNFDESLIMICDALPEYRRREKREERREKGKWIENNNPKMNTRLRYMVALKT